MRIAIIGAGSVGYSMPEAPAERTSGLRGEAMRTASAKDCHGLRGVSGARQRSGGVEKYSSIASPTVKQNIRDTTTTPEPGVQ